MCYRRNGNLTLCPHILGRTSDPQESKLEPWQLNPAFIAEVESVDEKLREILDVKQLNCLTEGGSTAGVESCNSTINKFAPKTHYFRKTMRGRIAACVLVWNSRHISKKFLQAKGVSLDEERVRRSCWCQRVFERIVAWSCWLLSPFENIACYLMKFTHLRLTLWQKKSSGIFWSTFTSRILNTRKTVND